MNRIDPAIYRSERQTMLERIRHFTPNWFAVTMGNGVVLLILESMPPYVAGQSTVAFALWCFDTALYASFLCMFTCRCVAFPATVRPLLHHPVQSMFLGAIPMGLVPIINGLILFGGRYLGSPPTTVPLVLWTLDAFLAVAIAVGVPYLAFTEQRHVPEGLTPVLLLPVVGPEVLASSAALLAPNFPAPTARLIVFAGYILWAISVPLAFSILTVIFFRLVIHKLPPAQVGPSSWLTLGPIGTGALGLLTLGQSAAPAFHGTAIENAAVIARDSAVISGLLLWGTGIWWLAIAIVFTCRYRSIGLPFNLGWWAFTFPPGVYALATLKLGDLTRFEFFSVAGQLMSITVVVLWMIVIGRTIREVLRGRLFQAPCLMDGEPIATFDASSPRPR
jgi:C4-dicarboxylate transporter/malic acid transport protein